MCRPDFPDACSAPDDFFIRLLGVIRVATEAGFRGSRRLHGALHAFPVMNSRLLLVVLLIALGVLALAGRQDGRRRNVERPGTVLGAEQRARSEPLVASSTARADTQEPALARRETVAPLVAPLALGDTAPEIVFRAVAVDPAGRSQAGVELALFELARGYAPARWKGRTGPDGEVRLAVAASELEPGATLVWSIASPRHAAVFGEQRLAEERLPTEVFLGRFELEAGATVRGRVLDPDGPRALAEVGLVAPATDWRPAGELGSAPGEQRSFPVTTDAEGDYELVGVPVGFGSVAARGADTLYAVSAAFQVEVGEVRDLPDLVLERADDEQRIHGRVLAADGQPASGALVRLLDSTGSVIVARGVPDPDGRFVFVTEPHSSHRLSALFGSGARLELRSLRPGPDELLLREPSTRPFQVRVLDDQGAAVRDVEAWTQRDGERWSSARVSGREPGPLVLAAPEGRFSLYARAPGYDVSETNSLLADELPPLLEVRLTPSTGLLGRVTANGRELVGADVHLHTSLRRAPDGLEPAIGELVASTRTLADGTFRFPRSYAASSRSVLHVHASGFGFARSASVSLPGGGTGTWTELALETGGTIDGLVVAPDGRNLNGLTVVASCGDGHEARAATDHKGSFRFEHMTAGPWQLDLSVPGPASEPVRRSSAERPPDLHVANGGVTRFVLSLPERAAAFVQLDGRLTFSGRTPIGWWIQDGAKRRELGRGGSFRLTREETGPLSVSVFAPRNPRVNATFTLEGELGPGPNVLDVDLPTGTLVIDGIAGQDQFENDPEPKLVLTWQQREGNAAWMAVVYRSKDGRAEVPDVPAGLVSLTNQCAAYGGRDAWPEVVRTLELAAGERREFLLPLALPPPRAR